MQIDSKSSWIPSFDKAFKAAIASKENQNTDGSINWNFVEADVHMDLAKTDFVIDTAALNEEFDWSADEHVEFNV